MNSIARLVPAFLAAIVLTVGAEARTAKIQPRPTETPSTSPQSASSLRQPQGYHNNRAPLVPKACIELPLGAVRPEGWLLDQLRRQADGMTGHLDEILPNLMGDRNGWLGGDGDKWERGPYWIDGLLPLAWILDDDALKAKAQRWIEWILSSQQEDGFFGPCEDLPNVDGLQRDRTRDWWPRMVVLKILQQYYEVTLDQRVIPFMTAYFRYQKEQLPSQPLGKWSYWAKERGGDNLMVVYWLYNITGEPWLLELGELLNAQTVDWKGRFSGHETLSRRFSLHCVNLAQGFKTPVIQYQASADSACLRAIDTAYSDLMKFYGWPTGVYGADEHLHSGSPTQGSELCTAVELMYSLERMIEITGRTDWADWLEKIAFNVLPTQTTDNYDARQYYQQLNQVEVSTGARNFTTNYDGTELVFGPVTGYPCCSANMHQGWPKFTRDLWMASADGGLVAMYYSPCSVRASVGDSWVSLSESGTYPFGQEVRIRVKDTGRPGLEFPLRLRIPGWCRGARICVNGELIQTPARGETACIRRCWKKGDEIVLILPMELKASRWWERSASIERGPLVFALKMEENWTRVEHDTSVPARYGEWHYEVRSSSPWNYCLDRADISALSKREVGKPGAIRRDGGASLPFRVEESAWDGSYPWTLENAPVRIRAKARRMPLWQMYNGSAGPLPCSPNKAIRLSEPEEITLIPYGCTTLRITEFPVN